MKAAPFSVCVMGVSGAGKTTVGRPLSTALEVAFCDADDLHSPGNRAKMAQGTALEDADRYPWLDAVADRFREDADQGIVIACSALRREYRDRIRARAPHVVFVHVAVPPALLATRLTARTDHFMPVSLLDSQLAALEELEPDEGGFVVVADRSVPSLVAEICEILNGAERTPDGGLTPRRDPSNRG